MNELNNPAAEAMSAITKSSLVIIVFDLNIRESFEEIITWTNFIRRTCNYDSKIYLFGNYSDSNDLLTEASDIDDVIKTSEQISEYFDIGKLNMNDTINLVDKLIYSAYAESESKARCDPNERYAGIGKSLDCYVI
jgi:hypothetical protein